MRSHSHLGREFAGSDRWNFAHGTRGEITNLVRNPEGSKNQWTAFSHSGKERNRSFLNLGDGSFANVSGISGADSISDSRSFVTWDFNRDGRLDIAVVNANRPLLQLFANRSGGGGGRAPAETNAFVAFRLVGAGGSNRDAIGAKVVVDTGDDKLLRVLSAGEGFASQNSKTLIVGIGRKGSIPSATATFPSGRVIDLGPIDAGTLVEIDELSGEFTTEAYSKPRA